MLRVEKRKQEADRDGLHLGPPQLLHHIGQPRLVERHRLAVRLDALTDREAEPARDERLGRPLRQVVERRPGLPRNLDHVTEALGGEESRPRAAPLEERVRRDRRPVRDRADQRRLDPRRRDRRHHAYGLVGCG